MVKKKKAGKASQAFIEGLAPVRIEAIDRKAEALLGLIADRKGITDEIHATQEALIDLLLKHDADGYAIEIDGYSYKFHLSKETKVKPKKLKIKRMGDDEHDDD